MGSPVCAKRHAGCRVRDSGEHEHRAVWRGFRCRYRRRREGDSARHRSLDRDADAGWRRDPVELTLTKAERGDFVAKARAYGCTVAESGELTSVGVLRGELRIHVGETNRITAAHLTLRRKPAPAEHRLGRTTLTIRADGSARWTF